MDMDDVVDLTNCDREPIHILGRVQSFGALVAVSPDWIVNHASGNVDAFLGSSADDMIGMPMVDFIDGEILHTIRSRFQTIGHPDSVDRLFKIDIGRGRGRLDIAGHFSGRSIVLEFERSDEGEYGDTMSYVRPMIDRIGRADSVDQLCEHAVRQLRGLTGFDRVMVYRFARDGSGIVEAESARSGIDSFLGLRYPASDIPQQARELYRRNLLRIISDVGDEGHTIMPARDPHGDPLDLSLSTTRAVSPIHIEYLRNMGVSASMSVSIIVRGELWGLFACHHYDPRRLPYDIRTAAELFGQLFGFMLDQKLGDAEREGQVRARVLHDQLMAKLAGGVSIRQDFETIAGALGSVIPFDGAVGWVEGEFDATGITPTREEFMEFVRFLNTTAVSRVYHTDSIGRVYAKGKDFADRAAGLLALPVSRSPRDYIVLFRREIARTVTWAGNPAKPATAGPHGTRLSPRKSFEAWKETARGMSEPWTDADVRAAEALRITLLEVVLRLADAAMRERNQAQERQELLIAELNHRVRNILNLIRSLVTQSSAETGSVAEFTEVIGGRIHALARAHDQITQQHWNPASTHDLVRTETAAYVGANDDRLSFTGPDVLLQPNAFTTLALVIHELVTNSAKYGALSDAVGHIMIDILPQQDGGIALGWRERGGPPIVRRPKRRGLGTTIIERSVPYELDGSADVRFEPSGLTATFVIPAAHIARIATHSSSRPVRTAPAASAPRRQTPRILNGDVLLVEDNFIIGMDAEQFLKDLGANRVHVSSSVSDALRLINRSKLSFAVLDVNLGLETSEAVAELLESKGVPFIFATGYGEGSLTEKFPASRVVLKPYDRISLEQAISERL